MDFINKIIVGDSREVLKLIPDNYIHLIITSPPYNVGIDYQIIDDSRDYAEYLNLLKEVFAECYRILVRGGRMAVNCPSVIMQHTGSRAAYSSIDILLLLREIGFLDREMITWVKQLPNQYDAILPMGKSTSWGSWQSPSNPALRDTSEFIIVMHKETPRLEGDKSKIDITENEFLNWTTNCWYFLPETRFRDIHPAPFPEELPRRLIKLYSYQDNIVLDPFNGIGTTTFVAKELKRKYIGIDINPLYCEKAKIRVGQTELFDRR